MTDPRRTPANSRVAAERLRGKIDGVHFVPGTTRQVAQPVVDLRRQPDGPRDRQLLFGETVIQYEDRQGWSFVEATRDGYCGYVRSLDLRDREPTTHRVTTAMTHVYPTDDFKAVETLALCRGSLLQVTDTGSRFARTTAGYVPAKHLEPASARHDDPAEMAGQYLGVPYLWGGNSSHGLDCSGLIQAACLRCGIECPGDSDMQRQELGEFLPDDADLRRNDLLFWNGHVGILHDGKTLLHANAHHMAVAYEPLDAAITRIERQGDGPVLSRKRLHIPS